MDRRRPYAALYPPADDYRATWRHGMDRSESRPGRSGRRCRCLFAGALASLAVKIPAPKDLVVALHLVSEAQELLKRAHEKFPEVLPDLLREIADKLEKNETHSDIQERAEPRAH